MEAKNEQPATEKDLQTFNFLVGVNCINSNGSVDKTNHTSTHFIFYGIQVFNRDESGYIVNVGRADPYIITEELFMGCFGGGPGRIPDTSGELFLSTGDMFPDKEYEFFLKISKGNREVVTEILITLMAAAPPVVDIV